MKFDLHVHSDYSSDGVASPKDILKQAKKVGLDGLCIADHNTLKGNLEARALEKKFGLIVIRGMEISSEDGHVLAYGIDAEIKRGLNARATVIKIQNQGGMAVIAHPYRLWSGVGERTAMKSKPDALETLNARCTNIQNTMARKLCKSMKVRQTAGSDAHEPENVGRAYVITKNNIDSEEGVLEAIRKGDVKVSGTGRTSGETLRYGYKSITQWAGRGFKRM